MTVAPLDSPGQRALSAAVCLAIYSLPVLFVWLLLRRGYSAEVRRGGFAFAFFFGLLPIVAILVDPSFAHH